MIERIFSPAVLLRCEGAAVCAAAVAGYAWCGSGWGWFALFILAPDLAMIGYAAGPRVGASLYNAAHTHAVPLVGGVLAWWFAPTLVPSMLIWIAHIGMDRAVGFGLKYASAFRDTHLARV